MDMGVDRRNGVQRGGFDPHTVFESVLAGRLPADFVYRDQTVAAFMDIQPVTPGHVLVVPVVRAATLAELPPESGAHMFRVGQRVAAALRASGLTCEGVNLFLADGVVAGQTVFHLHLHVIPRYAGDDFAFKLPERYYRPPPRETLQAHAALIAPHV
jgi:diadenosine tetraphosphate (Ap4A) HIT family hydrolase